MKVRGVSVFSVGQQRPRFVEGILGGGEVGWGDGFCWWMRWRCFFEGSWW